MPELMGGLSLFLSGNLCLTTYCHYKKQCFPALFTDTIFRVWFDGFSLSSISYRCLLCKIDFPTSPVPLSYIYLQPVKCFTSLDLSSSNSLMTVFLFFFAVVTRKKKCSVLINLWIIQYNTLFERHSPWDLQLASAVVGCALSMSGACWRDQCTLWTPTNHLSGNSQPLPQQHFCYPLCKMRASRNVSTKNTRIAETLIVQSETSYPNTSQH